MKIRVARFVRALLAAALLAAGVTAAGHPAGASDLTELRARAQSVADEVTALEQRLASLHDERARLAKEAEDTTAEIGVLELQIHDATQAVDAAEARYTARAVEAYKSGTTGAELEMMLSTDDLGELMTIQQAAAGSAADDAASLDDLVAAKNRAEEAQDRLDERKQRLLAAQARVDAIGDEIEGSIAERHAVMTRLNREITELERQARAEARRLAAQPADSGAVAATTPKGGGPAPALPRGFTSTGVSFEGTASWYGPGFEGQSTASGQIFHSSLYTAASRDLPLGTWLYVTHEGRGVIVLVNDRGPYIDDRVLDLSEAAAEAIGITGLGWVRAEIVVKA